MYRNKVSGCIDYETLDELISAGIVFMAEDEKDYYIRTKIEDYYDNGMYRVNKATEKLSFLLFTEFISEYSDKTTPVNIEEFIKQRRKHSA